MNAEEAGKKGKKGQWSSKEPPVPRVNDVTLPGSAMRAKQHLPFLQRAGRVPGVVEFVLGGSRLKIHVPKEGVTLAFSPSAVRCPTREEPFAAEALAFTRSHALQREVEIEVEAVDKAGTFLGSLRVLPVGGHGKPLNLSVALLEAGLAKLQASFDPSRVPGGEELAAAQAKAQKAKLRLWQNWDPEAEKASAAVEADAEGDAAAGSSCSTVDVVITDVTDANSFYVQIVSEARAAWIADELAALDLDASAPPSTVLKAGDKCLAKFALDGQWYRARVDKADASDPIAPKYNVFFLDFGNSDKVTAANVRSMPPELAAVPPQAHPAALAYTQAPGLDADYGMDAAQRLSELVGSGRSLRAVIEGKERPQAAAPKGWGNAPAASNTAAAPAKLLLTLLLGDAPAAGNGDAKGDGEGEASPRPVSPPGEDYANSVNCILVEEGLARVVEPRRGRGAAAGEVPPVLVALRAAQDDAKRRHLGLWVYGDPGSDDDDDAGFPPMGGAKGGKR